MDVEDFTKPNGRFVANSEGQILFVPKLLPQKINYDHEMIDLLTKAMDKIGELRGIGRLITDPNVLIRRYVRSEATTSSKIEGTLVSINDILQHEIGAHISKQDAERLRLREVQNYIRVLESNLTSIRDDKVSITLDLIKQIHKDLMDGVRGHNMKLGEFRRVQNYIVSHGNNIESSTYNPPPPEYLDELLKNFENFIKDIPDDAFVLISCAIMHYQFEAIHPFEDGNGRVGRILIALLLVEKGILPQPLLYLSTYFEQNIREYYSGLLAVSQRSELDDWVKFFLSGIIKQTTMTIQNINKLLELKDRYKNQLGDMRVGSKSILLLDHLIENPFVTIPYVRNKLSTSYPGAKNIVQRLMEIGILEETTVKHKSKVFVAREIFNVLES